jgi:hypothetical protein
VHRPCTTLWSLTRLGVVMQRHIIWGHPIHPLALDAQGAGLLTDGMGTNGHNASTSGLDHAEVYASSGQMAQLDLRALWLGKNNNVRVSVDGGEETLLQGTVLPPLEGGGRRFRSKRGGKIEVLLVTDDLTSFSFLSLVVSAVCIGADGCGGNGDCVGGNCTCSGGYTGMGAYPRIRPLLQVLIGSRLASSCASVCHGVPSHSPYAHNACQDANVRLGLRGVEQNACRRCLRASPHGFNAWKATWWDPNPPQI